MNHLITYKLFESGEYDSMIHENKFNWEFYKKHPDVTSITSDVLLELEDRFKTKIEPLYYAMTEEEVLSIEIKPAIRTTGYVFSFSDIRDVVVELISQLEGNGLKFYRYSVETHVNKSGNWCRGVKDIINDNITKYKIYGFTVEFKS